MWQKIQVDKLNSSQSSDYCRNLRLEGFNDWRLPESMEFLQSFEPFMKKTKFSVPARDFFGKRLE